MSTRPSPSARRRPALVALAALLALLAPSAAAAAATEGAPAAFRYWGYFHLVDGEWGFAETGPADYDAPDGSVEGWRYATATADDPRFPRATPAFEDVCADAEAGADEKRVAVVLDYGRPADGGDGAEPPEPRAECAVVPQAATGADVLAAVAEVRADPGGLTCALDGYPAQGCGDPVAEVPDAAAAADEPVELSGLAGDAGGEQGAGDASTGDAGAGEDAAAQDSEAGPSGLAIAGAIAAVVAVAAIALLAMRRRRGLTED